MNPPDEKLLEVILTQRTVRRFKPDAVDPALLRRVLDAATRAPNARNQQAWRFLVVTDPAAPRARGARLARRPRQHPAGRADRPGLAGHRLQAAAPPPGRRGGLSGPLGRAVQGRDLTPRPPSLRGKGVPWASLVAEPME